MGSGTPPPGGCVRLAFVAAATAALLGSATLAGWFLAPESLAAVAGGRVPMAPSSALLLLLFGTVTALSISARGAPYRRLIAASAGAGVLAAVALLVASTLGISPGIEHLGLQIPGRVAGVPVGQRGTETVLIVEDELSILRLAHTLLSRLGYEVMMASSPVEAIALARAYNGDIHLIITDVVMPEMNGREVVDTIRSFRPGARCIFMSGYTADLIAERGVLDEATHFIEKPFEIHAFTEKVRAVLDLPRTSGDPSYGAAAAV